MAVMPINHPLVSIVIPAYQAQDFIGEAIKSLSVQTYAKHEIIVVSDGCTDDTMAVLRELSRHESRLTIVELSENVGVHLARANGVRASQGQVIGFLDADDWVHPEFIERMVSTMVADNSDVVICGIRFAAINGVLQECKFMPECSAVIEHDVIERFCSLELGTGSMCNKIYKREVLAQFVIDDFGEVPHINEDYLVNFGVFSVANRVSLINDQLYYYRQHPESVTASPDRARAFSRMLRAYVLCLETYVNRFSDSRKQIDRLYRHQLGFDAYQVPDAEFLEEYKDDLAESLRRLAAIHPISIYGLCHVFDSQGTRGCSLSFVLARFLRRRICTIRSWFVRVGRIRHVR